MITSSYFLKGSNSMFNHMEEVNKNIKNNTLEQAREKFEFAIEEASTHNDALFSLVNYATFLVKNKKYDWAVKAYQEALDIAQKDMISKQHDITRDQPEACILILLLLRYADLFLNLEGSSSVEKDSLHAYAEEISLTALKLAFLTDEIDIFFLCSSQLIKLQGVKKTYDLATHSYQELIGTSQEVNKVFILQLLAFISWEKGDKKHAIDSLNQLLKTPELITALNQNKKNCLIMQLAYFLANDGREKEAISLLDEIDSISCKTQLDVLMWKMTFCMQNNPLEAIETTHRFLELANASNLSEGQIYGELTLANILVNQKDYHDAIECTERAEKIAKAAKCDHKVLEMIHNTQNSIKEEAA